MNLCIHETFYRDIVFRLLPPLAITAGTVCEKRIKGNYFDNRLRFFSQIFKDFAWMDTELWETFSRPPRHWD